MNIQTIPKARQLTFERAVEVLGFDPNRFNPFTHKIDRPGCVAGKPAGTLCNGYRALQVDYKFFKASRVSWLMMTGEFPPIGMQIDHVNGVRHDDRWCNLRLVTPQQNAMNKATSRRNTSGTIGVHPHKASGKWAAEIGLNGRNIKLGCFEVKADAVAARCAAEKHYFGSFARRASNG